jgi:hypothetical protein
MGQHNHLYGELAVNRQCKSAIIDTTEFGTSLRRRHRVDDKEKQMYLLNFSAQWQLFNSQAQEIIHTQPHRRGFGRRHHGRLFLRTMPDVGKRLNSICICGFLRGAEGSLEKEIDNLKSQRNDSSLCTQFHFLTLVIQSSR